MKKIDFRKVAAGALAVGVALAGVGCDAGKVQEEVQAVSDDYMEDVVEVSFVDADRTEWDLIRMVMAEAEYELNEVNVDGKNATVEYVVTLPNFEELEGMTFNNMEEAEEYIRGLEMTTYNLEVELKNSEDAWEIREENACADMYAQILESVQGCVVAATYDDVAAAVASYSEELSAELLGDPYEIAIGDNATMVVVEDENVTIAIYKCGSPEGALDKFNECVQAEVPRWSATNPYVVVDNAMYFNTERTEIDGTGYYDGFAYIGYYVVGDMMIIVANNNDSPEAIAAVDAVVQSLGLTTPGEGCPG